MYLEYLIFHYRVVNFLVNMETIQDNHDRRVFELSLVMHLQFQTVICHRPFQSKVVKFWVAAKNEKNVAIS